ncbi:hypothetical protein B0T21DRAFT_372830 [Apiosordaria backusii]|uniref:Uncharacterized protein n=1 Tax=Apiosordaria backusii TaxID=314023 RepID=A0AA40E1V7_9PEZI|nr:hypothetical protein B0T21DRAFT_372830 [Apiosordaria backusii]
MVAFPQAKLSTYTILRWPELWFMCVPARDTNVMASTRNKTQEPLRRNSMGCAWQNSPPLHHLSELGKNALATAVLGGACSKRVLGFAPCPCLDVSVVHQFPVNVPGL